MENLDWVETPWGRHAVVHNGRSWAVKLLQIGRGQALSVQTHKKRAEKWTVLSGVCNVAAWQGDRKPSWHMLDRQSKPFDIPLGWKHTVEAVDDTVILEVIMGQYDPRDIVRHADRYGRS